MIVTLVVCLWEEKLSLLIVLEDISQAEEIQRMQELNEYKNQLFSTVTHNLKTPINSILPILEVHEANLDVE